MNFTIPAFSIDRLVDHRAKRGRREVHVGLREPARHRHRSPDAEAGPRATVDAKLGRIDTQGAPTLHQQGSQFLCTQSADPAARRCGTDLSGLTTDEDGKLRLIYWAPGEFVSAHTKIERLGKARPGDRLEGVQDHGEALQDLQARGRTQRRGSRRTARDRRKPGDRRPAERRSPQGARRRSSTRCCTGS